MNMVRVAACNPGSFGQLPRLRQGSRRILCHARPPPPCIMFHGTESDMTTSLRRQPPTMQPDDPRIRRQRGRLGRPRNFTALALITTAAAAAAVSLAGPAHAE